MDNNTENPVTATPETTRVVVANYVCMSITILVLGARAFMSAKWKRKIGLDDICLALALAAAITESVLTEHAVRRGLGTYIRPGNASRFQRLSELMYASDLFFLIAMLLAKFAVVRLVYRVASPAAISRGKLMALQICIGVWGAFAIPAIAFQCSTTMPWLYTPDRCVGSGALWYPTLILNILTDMWLAICAWSTVPEMQIVPRQRQIILGLFSTRFLACLLCIAQLALLVPALRDLNQPRVMPNPTVLKQFVMNASLLSAGIPVLYEVLATYRPMPSSMATIYNTDSDRQTTPLDDIKIPNAAILPKQKPSQGGVSETEAKHAPNLGNADFSSRFSLAFNKEIFGSKV